MLTTKSLTPCVPNRLLLSQTPGQPETLPLGPKGGGRFDCLPLCQAAQ